METGDTPRYIIPSQSYQALFTLSSWETNFENCREGGTRSQVKVRVQPVRQGTVRAHSGLVSFYWSGVEPLLSDTIRVTTWHHSGPGLVLGTIALSWRWVAVILLSPTYHHLIQREKTGEDWRDDCDISRDGTQCQQTDQYTTAHSLCALECFLPSGVAIMRLIMIIWYDGGGGGEL